MDKVIIYGCGVRGIHLFYHLDTETVLCFADNSKEKQGYVLEGKKCISYDELLSLDKNQKIIVSVENPHDIVLDLKSKGFQKVLTSDDLNMNTIITAIPNEHTNILKMKDEIEKGLYDNEELSCIENNDIRQIISDYRLRRNNEYC